MRVKRHQRVVKSIRASLSIGKICSIFDPIHVHMYCLQLYFYPNWQYCEILLYKFHNRKVSSGFLRGTQKAKRKIAANFRDILRMKEVYIIYYLSQIIFPRSP